LISDLGHNEKVVAIKAVGVLPLVRLSILVGAGERDSVEDGVPDVVLPDAGFDGADAYFVDGAITGFGIIVHTVTLLGCGRDTMRLAMPDREGDVEGLPEDSLVQPAVRA
jgi:hypothetical protein